MEKMWAGRTAGALDREADDFNSSIHFDSKMYKQDICGSMQHAAMLAAQGIISLLDSNTIIDGLQSVLDDIESGKIEIDLDAEDIHMFVEAELTKRIGDVGKRLHTARSRNDQVALDVRMYLRDETEKIIGLVLDTIDAILEQAKANTNDIMPGYTHLQRAQPITFAHHILAYAMMLTRDVGRLKDAVKRMNYSPLGSCALAGTTYPIDRRFTAERLGFDGVTANSIDGVSDRDFAVELLSAYSLIMMHLSRFSEEIILWSSWEFKFVELDDAYTTGSSIMPQKKNSDMAELVRGKTGRVYGDLLALLTTLKGLPLAYNKDMQEDKEAVFDGVETVAKCLRVFAPMIRTMKVIPQNMYAAAQRGFINATDLADYLTKKGMPFRAAYKTVGQIVAYCISGGKVLEDMTLDEYKGFSVDFEDDLYDAISLESCVNRRISEGSTGPVAVAAQIEIVTEFLKNEKH
ncbi:MAG: argininosuccinate lyase [Clostridia bacterium]|nr:argininosuccinate lyase [Clostridia bacterium]